MHISTVNYQRVIYAIIVAFVVGLLINDTYEIHNLKYRVYQLEEMQNKRNEIDKNIVDVLKDISDNQKEQNEKLEDTKKMLEQERDHQYALNDARNFTLDSSTDLCTKLDLTATDMEKIIAYWNANSKNGTNFVGHGEAFIEAAHETGLNPIYIFAHAAWESSWGNSYIARTKQNYYGINATDTEPVVNAYAMGDSMDRGIINGAEWIKENFYDNGCTDLNSMIYKGNYASAKGAWIDGITSIANSSIKVL